VSDWCSKFLEVGVLQTIRNVSLSGACALMIVACPSTDGGGNAVSGSAGSRPSASCVPGTLGCTSTAPGGSPAVSNVTGGTTASAQPAVAGVSGGLAGTAGAGAASGDIPCDAAQIISTRCTACHQTQPRFGAPMALMTASDFQAASKTSPARKTYELVHERIDPTDVAKRMPPTSLPALTEAEKLPLRSWLQAGAAKSPNGCAVTVTDLPTGGAAGAGGSVGAGGSGAVATNGGASTTPIEYNDPDMKCYKFLAHAAGNMTAPYSQGSGEQYVNFKFKAPWQGDVYSRAIKLAIDPNSKVIHHWLLFKLSAATTDGAVSPGASGTHPDGILLHGWAPGATPLYLDPDVGMKLEGNVGYELEVHFNNATGAPGDDQSGAEVCVTTKVPAHVAELSWVGTDSINSASATGNCAPSGATGPIHIIAAQPHMHLKGRHMKVTINHKAGGQQVIHDEDFSFDNQRYYVINDAIMMPGDTMTTTCTYSGPATFGMSTNNEMCYFFSMHWPGGALRSAGVGSALHGADSCM
jgi:hypothetical protein